VGLEPGAEVLRAKSGMHASNVWRIGDVIVKDSHPWTPTIHALLEHLDRKGFAPAPRLVGSGWNADGRETLGYIEGVVLDRGPLSRACCTSIGALLRALHEATASFVPPPDALWRPWFGRALGGPARTVGHCDAAPWNIVARDGMPVGLIDWEHAGPVNPLVELAQACWLNAKLHDDIVARREHLPSLEERAILLRGVVDGYGLSRPDRVGFVELMISFAMHSVAAEADEAGLMPDTALDAMHPQLPWAMAWRARAAAWMSRNRLVLEDCLS